MDFHIQRSMQIAILAIVLLLGAVFDAHAGGNVFIPESVEPKQF